MGGVSVGGGQKELLKAYVGQTLNCTIYNDIAYSYVQARIGSNGLFEIRAWETLNGRDTGWVAGLSAGTYSYSPGGDTYRHIYGSVDLMGLSAYAPETDRSCYVRWS